MRTKLTIVTALFAIVGVALSSCGAAVGGQPNHLERTSWVLMSLNGEDPLPGIEITADFESESIHGSSGCNNFGGSYRVDGDKIEIGEIESTLIGCVEPEGAMGQEQEFVALLGASERYQIEDGQLHLISSGEVSLVFIPQD